MEDAILTNLPLQWGFAGFSVVLLGVLVIGGRWLITKFLAALTEWNKVIQMVVKTVDNNTQAVMDLQAKLAERPCLLQGEEYITTILDRYMTHPIPIEARRGKEDNPQTKEEAITKTRQEQVFAHRKADDPGLG